MLAAKASKFCEVSSKTSLAAEPAVAARQLALFVSSSRFEARVVPYAGTEALTVSDHNACARVTAAKQDQGPMVGAL